MAHSGGGGSSSGGSYGGNGGSRSTHTIMYGSSHYYRGAHKYTYWYNGKQNFYYADNVLTKKDVRFNFITLMSIGFPIVIILVLILILDMKFSMGGPLDTVGLDKSIIINDSSGLISNEEEFDLYKRLSDFRDETGVMVSVVTSTHRTTLYSIEREAYDLYYDMFNDESHWLIYYVGSSHDRSDDWEWHLMCGDDCLKVLNTLQENAFMYKFQHNLESDISFADSVISAINEVRPYTKPGLMETDKFPTIGNHKYDETIGNMTVPFIGFIIIGFVLIAIGIVGYNTPFTEHELARMNATYVPGKIIRMKCEYCFGEFELPRDTKKCPGCGSEELHKIGHSKV